MATWNFHFSMLSEGEVDIEAETEQEAWEELELDDGWSWLDFDLVESWHDYTEKDGVRVSGATEAERDAVVAAAVQAWLSDDAAQADALWEAVETYHKAQGGSHD